MFYKNPVRPASESIALALRLLHGAAQDGKRQIGVRDLQTLTDLLEDAASDLQAEEGAAALRIEPVPGDLHNRFRVVRS